MLLDHFLQLDHVVLGGHFIGGNHLLIQTDIQIVILIQHIGDAAAHTCRKVLAGRAKHHHTASRHVLTAVIAYALHHRNSAGISHAEPLSGHTVNKSLSAGGPIERNVSYYNIFLRLKPASLRRINHQLSAGKPFSKVIVAVPYQLQGESPGDKSAEALASCPAAEHPVGILLQIVPKPSGNLRAKDRTEGSVRIFHVHLEAAFAPCVNGLVELL